MSTPTYTYANCDGSQNGIDFVRVLIPDTGGQSTLPNNGFIFSDQEISAFATINQQQGWQAGFYFSAQLGRYLPTYPSNYFRAAALALNSLAGNQARLLAISSLLDVKQQSVKDVVGALQDTAQQYLDMDDNSGAFVFAEQCTTVWGFIDRFWNQVQRQTGGFIA